MHCKLSHEMRNALTVIVGQCELHMAGSSADDENAARFKAISEVARRLAETLRQHECDVAGALHRAQALELERERERRRLPWPAPAALSLFRRGK